MFLGLHEVCARNSLSHLFEMSSLPEWLYVFSLTKIFRGRGVEQGIGKCLVFTNSARDCPAKGLKRNDLLGLLLVFDCLLACFV